jgi:hypothetical protein
VPGDYNRNTHAQLMTDLVVMTFSCDLTRMCSFMLDDARSELEAIPEGQGNLLDNTVIIFACGMHSGNHDRGDLPVSLIGGGGKTVSGTALKLDQHHDFATEQRLADVHLTIMQGVFSCVDKTFGSSSGIMPDLLS